MRVLTLSRRGSVGLGAAVILMFAAGCGGSSPTAASPTLTTETFTGTVKQGGTDFKTFQVAYALSNSDASVAVTSLTLVATGAALDTTIGVGFGTIAFDQSCTRAAAYSSTTARLGQELVAQGVFGPGPFCVQVFDAGTLTGDTAYSITVKHY
jgi:hypothetical protein